MKEETKYERKGNTIRDLSDNSVKEYPSINKAKKASVALQAGAQGQGSVRVAK